MEGDYLEVNHTGVPPMSRFAAAQIASVFTMALFALSAQLFHP